MEAKECEKSVYNIWCSFGSPHEINNSTDIENFLRQIIEQAGKHLLFDHFSGMNYDYIDDIVFEKGYTKIIWKNFDNFRKDYLNKQLSDSDFLEWQIFGYSTQIYFATKIQKLKIINHNNHLFILIKPLYETKKQIKKNILGSNTEITYYEDLSDLECELKYMVGSEKEWLFETCKFSNLPYYSSLIQPRAHQGSIYFSKKLCFSATIEEILNRLDRINKYIDTYNSDTDPDDISEKGNTIRSIMELALKYCCVLFNSKLEIEDKYGHILLGELRKEVEKFGILISQSFVNTANILSHDSGKNVTLDELIAFRNDANDIIQNIITASKNEAFYK